MQGGLSLQGVVPPTPYNPTQHTEVARSQSITGSLVILLPVVVVCAIVGHRKHKATVLQ